MSRSRLKRFRLILLVVAVLFGGSAAMGGCPPPPPQMQCTSTIQGSGSNLGAYRDPNITNSNGFNTYDANNGWGAQPGTTATICGPADTNGPATPMTVSTKTLDNSGTVQTYPDIQQETNNFGSDGQQDFPLDSSIKITSSYNVTDPALSGTGEWEAAYDLWNSGHYNEIMIWTQTSAALTADGHGGATQEIPHVTIGGVDFSYWQYGNGLPFLVRNDNANSGTIDIRACLNYLKTINIHGTVPTTGDPAVVQPGTKFGQMDYGWEVRGLNGTTQNFAINSYSLALS